MTTTPAPTPATTIAAETPEDARRRRRANVRDTAALVLIGCGIALLAFGCITQGPALPFTTPEQVLAKHRLTGVTVLISDDPDLNCGVARSFVSAGGCFDPAHPDRIVISSNLTVASQEYVTLHEYAHLTQHRNGQRFDECEADEMAAGWGVDRSQLHYDC